MLKKLIKHDLIAIKRILIPVYIIAISLSVVSLILTLINSKTMYNSPLSYLNNFQVSVIALGVIAIVVVLSVSFFTMIGRYQKTVYGLEGYMTNTLPVKASQIIISKAIVTVVVSFVSMIVALVCIMIMAAMSLGVVFSEIGLLFKQLFIYCPTGHLIGYILEFILIAITYSFSGSFVAFSLISFSYLFKNRKWGGIITAIIVVTLIEIFFNGFINIFISGISIDVSYGIMHIIFISILVFNCLLGVGCFFLNKYLLERRLNLE